MVGIILLSLETKKELETRANSRSFRFSLPGLK